MRNKVIIISLVMMARLGFGQTFNWPSVGMVWYYENDATAYVPGSSTTFDINYIKYECIKDSTYETFPIKIISVSGMSNGGYGVNKSKMFIKQEGQRLDYKFKDDVHWFYFSHLNYTGVTTFSGYVRETSTNVPFTSDPESFVIFKNEGSFLTSVNGQTFDSQSLSFETNNSNLIGNASTIITIGGTGSFYPFSYRIIDLYITNNIRCYKNNTHDLQFSERSCTYKRQEVVLSLDDNKIVNSKLSIYPTLIKDETNLKIKFNKTIENGYFIIFNPNLQSIHESDFTGNEINIPNRLSSGIYCLKLLINNKIYYEKFIVL